LEEGIAVTAFESIDKVGVQSVVDRSRAYDGLVRAVPAGDHDYEQRRQYSQYRQTDPRIEKLVHDALGQSRSVVNVGAGAGSYEPLDRHVIAIEPSLSMRSQRPPERVPAIDAIAENLPLDDDSVDAAMAMITIHQWTDGERGLAELVRVARQRVVILTFDGDALDRFWLADYSPELITAEARRYPKISRVCELLGRAAAHEVPIPIDCSDGFTEAFYARPEAFLNPEVRAAQSAWSFVDESDVSTAIGKLNADLTSGAWDERFGSLRSQPEFVGSLRLIVAEL
jgi:ubiquinone/menaquinone biosynthesis C-methylase UbiE